MLHSVIALHIPNITIDSDFTVHLVANAISWIVLHTIRAFLLLLVLRSMCHVWFLMNN